MTLAAPKVEIDHYSHRAYVDGKEVFFTPQEWRALELLEYQRATTNEELAEALFGSTEGEYAQGVRVYISRIRRKLGSTAITTLRGWGYRFDG